MSPLWFLSLRERVSVAPGGECELVSHGTPNKTPLSRFTPGILAALQRLGNPGEYEDRLADLVLQTDGPGALNKLDALLQHFTQQGRLLRSLEVNGERLATIEPISPYFSFTSRIIVPEREYIMSRFAYTRKVIGEMILESPLSHARIILHDWRAAVLIHFLAQPGRPIALTGQIPALSATALAGLMTLLSNAQMLWELNDQGTSLEDEATALQSWEFHDLLFHARNREGRHDYPVGGTYRFVGRLDPPPVVKTVQSHESFVLYRPDLDRLEQVDPPFAWVQEARRSIREYAETPVSDRQVGEFLYRVGRVADYWECEEQTPGGSVKMDFAPRPYPGAGGLYELELYVAINVCENLASGLYYYDSQQHRLDRLAGRTTHVEELLLDASKATGIPSERLQILIIIAARFQRIAWKYSSIAYGLILKHVGVVYQTMYLVATAMRLAPCSIGSGNSDLFARAAGTDYFTETSVGEFLLGSKM